MVKDLLWLKIGRRKFYEKQILYFHHGMLSTQLVLRKKDQDREMEFILQWKKCYLANAEWFLSLWRNSYYMMLSAGSFEHKIVQRSEKSFSRVWLFAILGSLSLLQGSHKGSPRILEWVGYSFSSGSFPLRNQTGVSWIVGGFFTNWVIRECKNTF